MQSCQNKLKLITLRTTNPSPIDRVKIYP